MIYTVSFNPSLDYVQDLDCVNLGYVNRTSGEKILRVEKESMYLWY